MDGSGGQVGCGSDFDQGRWGVQGSLELATGGVDVAAARPTDESGDTGVAEALLEGGYILWDGFVEGHVGAGVPDDEVDLCP